MPPSLSHPDSPFFSRETALYLAHAADIAYFRQPAEAARERLGLFVHPFRHKLTRARGFLGVCDSHAVLAFRGTQPETLANWVLDLSAKLSVRAGYEGRVHTGFSASLKSVWPEVEELLPIAGGRPLFLTGHSMGGALAVLAGCKLARLGSPAVATYTFGAPRVGDDAFCADYLTPTWRVVNRMDIVPEVPLAGLQRMLPAKPRLTNEKILARLHLLASKVRAYGHVRTYVHIDGAGTIHVEPAHLRWTPDALARALAGPLPARGKALLSGVTDHLIGNYIRALEDESAAVVWSADSSPASPCADVSA